MQPDLELLQRTAKSRLKFTDDIIIRAVPQSELEIPGLGPQYAAASWDPSTSQYVIKYVAECQIEDCDFFHEFCHLKLIEIGFKEVEIVVQQKAGLYCKSGSEQDGMNNAVRFIAEPYANYLLFRYFQEESESLRERLDLIFCIPTFLREKVKELGYRAIAQGVIYRVAKKWCEFNDDVPLRAAFEEGFRGNNVLQTYTRLNSIMSELPPIRECEGQIQNMRREDVDTVVKCVLKVFENEREYRG